MLRKYLYIDEPFISMIHHQEGSKKKKRTLEVSTSGVKFTRSSDKVLFNEYEMIDNIEKKMDIDCLEEKLKDMLDVPIYWNLGNIVKCDMMATQLVINDIPKTLKGVEEIKLWIACGYDERIPNLYLIESLGSNPSDIRRPHYSGYSYFLCVINSLEGIDVFDDDALFSNRDYEAFRYGRIQNDPITY